MRSYTRLPFDAYMEVAFTFYLQLQLQKPLLNAGICSSKAARSVNPRRTNLTLHGIRGDTGTRPWKDKQ
jgi:hypothetical protein